MRLAALGALTLAASLLTGCRDSTAPDTGSRFDATVSGAENRALTGTMYVPFGDRFYDIVLIAKSAASDTGAMIMLDTFAGIGPGSHTVGGRMTGTPGDFTARYDTRSPTSPSYTYYSTGGTVVIDAISAARVRGRFDVTLAVYDTTQASPPTVHVVGTFNGPADGQLHVARETPALPEIR